MSNLPTVGGSMSWGAPVNANGQPLGTSQPSWGGTYNPQTGSYQQNSPSTSGNVYTSDSFGWGNTDNLYNFGGAPGGANAAANSYANSAYDANSLQAPSINAQYTSQDAAGANAGLAGQQQSIDLLQSEANGGNTAPLQAQSQAGLAQNAAQQQSLARSAGFGARGAAAQRATGMNNATAAGTASNALQQQEAQQQQAATAQLGQATAAYTGQNQALTGLANQYAIGAGGLSLAQLQQNAGLTQGYQNLAQQTENEQLQANQGQYNTGSIAAQNQALAEQQAAANARNNWTSAAFGAAPWILAMADVHLAEPGGGAHWSLREEPTFLLARNERTGEMRKLATEPLSHDERRQALAPHGAGPLGSTEHPRTRTFADLSLGSSTGLGPRGMAGNDEATRFMSTMGGAPQQQLGMMTPQARTKQTNLAGPAMQTPSIPSRPATPMTGSQALAAMPAGENRLRQIIAAQQQIPIPGRHQVTVQGQQRAPIPQGGT